MPAGLALLLFEGPSSGRTFALSTEVDGSPSFFEGYRASGGRNFDRLAGQNSPVWHTLFLFYLVVAKKSQKGKQPHAASYEALEAQVAEYMEACLVARPSCYRY